jgi:hypothetical protein
MKVYYREPTLLELMNDAVRDSATGNTKPIEYFELNTDELNSYYSYFDRTIINKIIHYSYKGIPIKVSDE